MTSKLAAALLANVPRYNGWSDYNPAPVMYEADVLAALSAHLDAAQAREMADLSLPTILKQTREDALREAVAKATEHVDMHNGRDMNSYRAALGVRDAILALIGEART